VIEGGKYPRKEDRNMKKLLKKFETSMMAVTFAEAGEFETARQILTEEEEHGTDRPILHGRTVERKKLRADWSAVLSYETLRDDMKKLKKMMETMENAMAAASFAEEGQFESARQMLKEERRVLLAVREHRIDRKTLKYALNTCRRVEADLDILYVSVSGAADPVLDGFLSDLRAGGVPYRVIERTWCLKQAIIDYTNSRKEVLFVVIESSDNLDVDCSVRDRRLSESWNNLKCPLVVVSEAKA
jgi:hypothetical protein